MAEALAGSAPAAYALPRDTLLARGPDRKPWLDGLITCSVAPVVPGQAGYGLLLTKQGKIVSDVFLVDDGNQLFIGVAPGHGESARELLDRYLVMEDAELEGPLPATAWRLAEAPPAAAPAWGQLQLGGLAASLWVERDVVTPALDATALAGLLAAHGLGVFGVDFSEHDNPHEASLDRIAVSWTKGCYLGQEVVCMQDMRGKVKRRLVALEGPAQLLQATQAQAGKASVLLADGSVVGQVSSAHANPAGGVRLLASVAAAALEGSETLSVLGESVRVVAGRQALLS
jgi:folate-binding protein YgfZ